MHMHMRPATHVCYLDMTVTLKERTLIGLVLEKKCMQLADMLDSMRL